MRSNTSFAARLHLVSAALGLLALVGPARAQGNAGEIPAPEESADTVAQSGPKLALTLEGFVLAPDGMPAEGAVVVSSAGGSTVTDVHGGYALEISLPFEGESLQVTAVGATGRSLLANTRVSILAGSGSIPVPTLNLGRPQACSPSWLPTFGGAPGTDDYVRAVAVYDDGAGPALYAGGDFTAPGGTTAYRIAKWDGTSWTALGIGMNGAVRALTVYDDGAGPALYAGGGFTTAGGAAANHIAKWDGTSWTALGSGMNCSAGSLAVYDDGEGSALYGGGCFSTALDSGDSYIAKWGCEPDTTAPVLTCPAPLTINAGFGVRGTRVTFLVTATDDQDPAPVIVCTPPSGSVFPPGTTLVTCTATDAAGNQSSCEFPVTVRIKARKQ